MNEGKANENQVDLAKEIWRNQVSLINQEVGQDFLGTMPSVVLVIMN